MGREWYNGGRSICSSKSKRKSNEANGCITALYHFFHFHRSYFPSRHHHNQPSTDSHYPKGLVAPRNSLELTEESPLSTNYKENKSLNIPVNGAKSKLRDLFVDTSSDFCNSPLTKTPNVVARLMGIDLLPDNLYLNRSRRISVRRQRHYENSSGTRSLPESPRISSARKSDSDIRRLSLQLNREIKHEEFGCWQLKELKQDEESRSPGHNGRKLVKQIKERVITRRVGMDITNLVEDRKAGAAQNQIELRKVRSRFSQKERTINSNPTFVFRQNQITQEPKLRKVTHSKDSKEDLRRVNEQPLRPINGRKKADSESRFSPHPTPNNRNKQRRAFLFASTHSKSDRCDHLGMKKCKKIPNSNDIFNIAVASSAFSATERPRKQMKRAEEPERNADATICSGQMYRSKEKLPQEPSSSNMDDSTTIYGIFDSDHLLPRIKNLEEEEESVVADIERHIVDALLLDLCFVGLNVSF